ncbi:MAG: DUF2437 domain-containing protein, partial [Emcibacteraceae bacterium]|nr:DUF2437 domain-containing protein [Emcibacteraceae bacterium]
MKYNFNRIFAVIIFLMTLPNLAFSETYVRYEQGGKISWGEPKGDLIHQLSNAPYLDGMATGETVSQADVKMMAPVDPRDVYMTGFNYEDHVPEGQKTTPYPGLFMVPAGTLIGPEDDIVHN